jgi:hypothetical protein
MDKRGWYITIAPTNQLNKQTKITHKLVTV